MKNAGFTLLELMFTITIMAIVIMSLISVIITCNNLDTTSAETTFAMNKATEMLERVVNTDFDDIITTFASVKLAEGVWVGGFDVDVLEPRDNDQDGKCGKILFVVNETLYNEETFTLGFPRDLDGDWMSSNVDTSATAQIIPVIVKIEWKNRYGERSYDLRTLLTSR